MISSTLPVVPSARTSPAKLTIMPSPMESKEPSDPHMQTLAVIIGLQKEFDWLVKRQACRMGAA